MVLLVQLCIFAVVVLFFRRSMLGKDLRPVDKNNPQQFESVRRVKGTTYRRKVGVAFTSDAHFVIRRERWHHRVLKQLGIASELDSADAEMNRSLYFISDDPEFLRRALHSDALREAIKALFALPVKSLHAMDGKIWCHVSSKHQHLGINGLAEHFALLNKIATSIPSQAPIMVDAGKPIPRRPFVFVAMALHMGLLAMGLFGFLPAGLDDYEVVLTSEWLTTTLPIALLAVCLWGIMLIAFFGGTAWAGWVIADFVLTGIAGLMLTCTLMAREANIHLDTSPAEPLTTQISKQYCTLECSKGSGKRRRSTTHHPSYAQCNHSNRAQTIQNFSAIDYKCTHSAMFRFHVQVPHWRRSGEAYTFKVHEMLYDRVRVGSAMQVLRHPGKLGIEWLDVTEFQPMT